MEKFRHLRGQGPIAQQVINGHWIAAETPNRQDRAVHRQRRDDGVDPRAIGQPRIDHRRGLVDPAADAGDDPAYHVEQMRIVLKSHLGQIQFPFALDVNPARPVDQNVADRVVAQQRLQRPQAEDFVLDLFDQPRSIAIGHQPALLLQVPGDRGAQAASYGGRIERFQLGNVDGLQQMLVNLDSQIVESGRFAGSRVSRRCETRAIECAGTVAPPALVL